MPSEVHGGTPHLSLSERARYRLHLLAIKPDKSNSIPPRGEFSQEYLEKTQSLRASIQNYYSKSFLTDFNSLFNEAIMTGDVSSMEFANRQFQAHPLLTEPIFSDNQKKPHISKDFPMDIGTVRN